MVVRYGVTESERQIGVCSSLLLQVRTAINGSSADRLEEVSKLRHWTLRILSCQSLKYLTSLTFMNSFFLPETIFGLWSIWCCINWQGPID